MQTRETTEAICSPLAIEDHVVQVDEDTSPPKWHLGHTTWFFETFVLKPALGESYSEYSAHFNYLFNSYYESQGERVTRTHRGTYSRPTVKETLDYRQWVNRHLLEIRQTNRGLAADDLDARLTLGLHHEQQHQELLYMDILALLSRNPEAPRYAGALPARAEPGLPPSSPISIVEGLYRVGHDSKEFCFDNERPAHTVHLDSFRIEPALVTNAEYRDFVADGGYERAELWLSDGWEAKKRLGWEAPLHWKTLDGEWFESTLNGLGPLDPNRAVRHVSYYEADAFAQWRGTRLPTELEWETSERAKEQPSSWELWQWTSSPYVPYPGYKRSAGAFGEYNGKFMCNQMILRGGCEFTPPSHYRVTYRNFYQPEKRWSFTGLRLIRK